MLGAVIALAIAFSLLGPPSLGGLSFGQSCPEFTFKHDQSNLPLPGPAY